RFQSRRSSMKHQFFVHSQPVGQPGPAAITEPSLGRAPLAKPPVIRSDSNQPMPEIPPLAPERAARKRRQTHALLNKAQTHELNKAKKICAAALSQKCRAILQLRGITDLFLAGLVRQIDFCRQKSSEAMQQT